MLGGFNFFVQIFLHAIQLGRLNFNEWRNVVEKSFHSYRSGIVG